MSAQKRIEELINLINYHNEKYYNQDSPEIEDFEYDNLMKELIKLEEENTEIKEKWGCIRHDSDASSFTLFTLPLTFRGMLPLQNIT